MPVERLTEEFDIKKSGDRIMIYGHTADHFLLPELTVLNNLEQLLFVFLRRNGFDRIIFISPGEAAGIYTLDKASLEIKGASTKDIGNTNSRNKSQLADMGFEDDDHWEKPPKKDTPRQETPLPGKAYHKFIKDKESRYIVNKRDGKGQLELLDLMVKEDFEGKTAFVFTGINQQFNAQSDRTRSYMERLDKLLTEWIRWHGAKKIKYLFQFEGLWDAGEVQRFLDTRDLQSLRNVFDADHSLKAKHRVNIGVPKSDEVERWLDYVRIKNSIPFDWANRDRLIEGFVRQNLQLKELEASEELLLEMASIDYDSCVKQEIIRPIEFNVDRDKVQKALSKVVGQADSARIISRSLFYWLQRNEKKSPQSYFLVGTSGVGKTYTVKLLAEALESSGYLLSRYDMNEYQESHAVSKLLGAPPGYVGHNQPSPLLTDIRKSSRLVLLFDEIEKAHPNILRALMGLLDEGRITFPGAQETIDFTKCIIFFTSNLEREAMVEAKTRFLKDHDAIDLIAEGFQKRIRAIVKSKGIVPEIVGRIKKYIVYSPLGAEYIVEIALKEISERLAKEFKLKRVRIAPELLSHLADQCEKSQEGLRPLNGAIENLFESLNEKGAPNAPQYELLLRDGRPQLIAFEGQTKSQSELVSEALKLREVSRKRATTIDEIEVVGALSKIKGQSDNIEIIAESLSNWFALKKKKHPLSFYLIGASGVGKTYSVELFAALMEQKGYDFKVFRMSEFGNEIDVNKLKGSPPGYQGNAQAPPLLDAIRKNERLVILFDEIEKAHPNAFTFLMQLLEKGEMAFNHDGNEQIMDFKQCIVFFTSNTAMKDLIALKHSHQKTGQKTSGTKFKSKVANVLVEAKVIRPEPQRRVGGFLVFNTLKIENLIEITYQELVQLASNYQLVVEYVAPEFLAETAALANNQLTGIDAVKEHLKSTLQTGLREVANSEINKVFILKSADGFSVSPSSPNHGKMELPNLFEKSALQFNKNQESLKVLDQSALLARMAQVKGQDDNIEEIVLGIAKWYIENNHEEPYTLFLVGRSGTGKTFTAEVLAAAMESYGYGYYYLDCNLVSDQIGLSRVIGTEKGIVHSDEKPELFKQLDYHNGKLILLFDEIEKAYSEFTTRIMQLLEKGKMDWAHGKGDFRDCIILFTSNHKMEELTLYKQKLQKSQDRVNDVRFQQGVFEILKGGFLRNELERRINKFLVYNPLSEVSLLEIIYEEIQKQARKMNLEGFAVTPEFLVYCYHLCVDQSQGIGAIRKLLDQKEFNQALPEIIASKSSFAAFQPSGDHFILKPASAPGLERDEAIELALDLIHTSGDVLIDHSGFIEDDLVIEVQTTHRTLRVTEDVEPAVGLVMTEFQGKSYTGTGFCIDPKGYVLTCWHVVERAGELQFVTEKQGAMAAHIVAVKKELDLAILKVDSDQFIDALPLIGRKEKIKKLEPIVLLGFPLGQEINEKVTCYSGDVNGFRTGEQGERLIQINADATYGLSGGPIVRKVDGKVIGFLINGIAHERTRAASFNFAQDIRQIYDLGILQKTGD